MQFKRRCIVFPGCFAIQDTWNKTINDSISESKRCSSPTQYKVVLVKKEGTKFIYSDFAHALYGTEVL